MSRSLKLAFLCVGYVGLSLALGILLGNFLYWLVF